MNVLVPPDVVALLTKVGVALLLVVFNSVLVALRRFPGNAPGGQVARLLGRLSVLRFTDSPGTLHVPGTAQPQPGARAPARPPGVTPTPGSSGAAVALCLLLSTACVPGLATTERTLAQAVQTQTGAVADFIKWDAAHQLDLVRSAKSRQEAATKLGDYRTARSKLVDILKQSAEALVSAAASLQQGAALTSAPVGGAR